MLEAKESVHSFYNHVPISVRLDTWSIYEDLRRCMCYRIFCHLNGFTDSNNGRRKGPEMPISLHIHKIMRCKHATPYWTACIRLRGKLCYLHCKYSSFDHYNEFTIRPTMYWKERNLLDCSRYICITISAIYFTLQYFMFCWPCISV